MSSQHRFKFAAILVRGKRIIKIATNRIKTDPKISRLGYLSFCRGLHAEVAAINRVDATGASLVVIRTSKTGVLGMARPCDICMHAIRESGVKDIWFTDTNGNLQREVV